LDQLLSRFDASDLGLEFLQNPGCLDKPMSQTGTETCSRLTAREAVSCQHHILCFLALIKDAEGKSSHEQGRIRNHFCARNISGIFLPDDVPEKILLLPVNCIKSPKGKLATIIKGKRHFNFHDSVDHPCRGCSDLPGNFISTHRQVVLHTCRHHPSFQ
jgi:hypothetical protein